MYEVSGPKLVHPKLTRLTHLLLETLLLYFESDSELVMMRILKTGLGTYGWLHSLLWLDVLQNLEGPFNIHQCPAQQKGSTLHCFCKQNITMIMVIIR